MNIVVLSRNGNLYSTKRLLEAAEKRGHTAQLISHTHCYVVIEKGAPTIFYNNKELTNIDAVIPRIGLSVTYYGSAIIRQFEAQKIYTTLTAPALIRSRDKLRTLQLLSMENIALPKTVFARHPDDIDHVIKQVGGAPLIIKLIEGTQGLGVVLAETKKAAKSVIEAFYGMNANFLVQEFVKEAKGTDIRAFVVGDKVIGAMVRQGKEDEFRSNLHRGGSSNVIKLKPEEEEVAIRAAHALGLQIAGVDMLPSERGMLVIEVNSSPGLEGIEVATGKNIAGEIIAFIEKEKRVKN
ncbi:MAG: 30S ribosomal protein S6--L-glutamate ligase [Bacteroidetes bacterium]|nr:30S ribosomal protein S6--L-glutamate ligase [Bacteroidota bacterium]